jgi:hypothetical protein
MRYEIVRPHLTKKLRGGLRDRFGVCQSRTLVARGGCSIRRARLIEMKPGKMDAEVKGQGEHLGPVE